MNATLKFTGLTTLLAAAALMTGCATSGRYVALKEFSSPRSATENSPLKGRTVCVKPFLSDFNIDDRLLDKNPIEPPNYTYVKMNSEEVKRWDEEDNLQKKTTAKSAWPQIGYVRNGFGSVMSEVYALNDPGAWLADTLKADLQKLGARVVEPSQADGAEITIGGVIKYFKIDAYTSYWADLVVDVQLKPRTKESTTLALHTKAGQAGFSSSSFEYYQSLRQCQQKFSRLVITDMEQVPKDDPSVKTYEEAQKAPELRGHQIVPALGADLPEDGKAFAQALESDNPGLVIRALRSLRKPQYAEAVPAILPLLNRQNAGVVREACRTLAVIANKDVIPSLEPLLEEKNSAIRKDAQDAITALRAKP